MLAGGIGSRFWPASTPDRPKQLLALGGGRPLIAETVDRALALVPSARLRVLTGGRLAPKITGAVPELEAASLMVEPRARGTGPALAWAAWSLWKEDPEALLVSLHSDHHVAPLGAFVNVVGSAARLAEEERLLVTLPIPPDRPEVGYGYVQPGAPIDTPDPFAAFRVRAFHEKPDRETAARYVKEGFLWNSGIFVWRADLFLEEVRCHAPEIGDLFPHLEAGRVERYFDEAPSISVDEAILERSERVGAVEAAFRWDDVGSWEALARTLPEGEAGNRHLGEAHTVEGRDNIVYAEGGPVVLFGVEGLVVVRTKGVTFVTRRERAPHLKALLSHLPDALRNPDV